MKHLGDGYEKKATSRKIDDDHKIKGKKITPKSNSYHQNRSEIERCHFLCHSVNYVSDLDLFRFFFPVSMVRVLEFF